MDFPSTVFDIIGIKISKSNDHVVNFFQENKVIHLIKHSKIDLNTVVEWNSYLRKVCINEVLMIYKKKLVVLVLK